MPRDTGTARLLWEFFEEFLGSSLLKISLKTFNRFY